MATRDPDVAILVCQPVLLRWTFERHWLADMEDVPEPPTFILQPAAPCPILSPYYAFSLLESLKPQICTLVLRLA